MAKNYYYKESTVISKKMVGAYNAETVDIEIDGETKNIIDELKAFNNQLVEITIKTKEENELLSGTE